ncbi:MAG: O-methyltransferase [Bacteroidota bacterium]
MELVHPLVEAYAEKFSSPDIKLLEQIQSETMELHPHAHMLSSKVQGKILAFLSQMIHPEKILEIGSFTGYSALCLAEGLSNTGELHTIELRTEDAQTAKLNFSKSAWNKQIHLHIGDAKEIIPSLPMQWDLVFIDADKTGYIDYYELIVPRLSKTGWIIADNVLFHGQVLDDPISGKNAKAIQAFNEHVLADERTEQVLLSIRDGLLLIKKKN